LNKRTQKIIVLLIDFFSINFAWGAFFYIRVETGWFKLLIMPEMLIPMLVIYFYWLIIFTFVGMYRTWFASSRFDEISTLFKATFVGIFILFFLIYLDDFIHGVESSSRILIFIYWLLLFVIVSSGRLFVRSLQRNLLIRGIGRKCSIIVGFNPKAHEVHDQILEHPALGLDIEGLIKTFVRGAA
jgi:FlaA1/EpsC-like NDP-sugar epimerase